MWTKRLYSTQVCLVHYRRGMYLIIASTTSPLQSLFLSLGLFLPTHCRCRWLLLQLITLIDTHTLGRTPLDEGSARRRGFYLTTHNTQKRQTSMPQEGFERAIPASERPQTYALRPMHRFECLECNRPNLISHRYATECCLRSTISET